MKKYTIEEHIRKHTNKENTYNSHCEYCNYEGNDIEIRRALLKRGLIK